MEETGEAPPAAPTPGARPPQAELRITPLARRLARQAGLDPASIEGTGAGGRITRDDVLRAAAAGQASGVGPTPGDGHPAVLASATEETGLPPPEASRPTPDEEDVVVPLSPMRRRIAARMLRSAQTIPHVTTVVEADMTPVAEVRERHKAEFEEAGLRLTYTPFVMKAVVEALAAFPEMNASWGGDRLILHRRVHLGMAVAVEGGLAVPVIRNADALSLRQLTRRLAEVAEHARAAKLPAEEAEGSTFTITNPGIFGAVVSTPIINPPNAAILALERIAEAPAVRCGKVVVRLMTHLCLSYDHRIVDGETAIKFLQRVRQRLESGDFDLA